MQRQVIKGERKHNIITFNPNNAKMGEKIYLTIPALDSNLSIVPGTTNLLYTLKNSNTKSWINNNMGRLLVQGLQVKLGKDVVYNNTGESIFRIYEDLWKSKQEREALMGVGIGSLEFRKSLSGSDDASNSSLTNGKKDVEMAALLKTQRVPLGLILDNHGLHSPRGLGFDTKYEITLPDNSASIGGHQSSQQVGDFSLEEIQLEYDTVHNPGVVDSQRNSMVSGRSYIIHHLSLENKTTWAKSATSINENLHISRESLKTIIYLFKWADQGVDENFVYPNITEVACTINGKPNVIHSNPMKTDSMEREARRCFEGEYKEISTPQFFNNTFAPVSRLFL